MAMIFDACTWHALAKLRVHTETTLADLEAAAQAFTASVRRWKTKTCDLIVTHELEKESAARDRREGKKKGTKIKSFNWNTYKAHRITDYPRAIRLFGTSEGWSTWRVRI